MLVENRDFFHTPLHSAPPLGGGVSVRILTSRLVRVSSSQDETFIVGSTYLLTYCVALLSLLVCVPDLFLDRMSVTNFRDGRDLGQGRGSL